MAPPHHPHLGRLARNRMREEVTEQWRPVPEYEGLYEVSDLGRVRSLDRRVRCAHGATRLVRGVLLAPRYRQDGHIDAGLTRGNKKHNAKVHRLVMEAFVGPCPPGREVLHRNGIPDDNRLSNLQYGTRSQNLKDAVDHGTHAWAARETCSRGHQFAGANLRVQKTRSGSRRICVACHRAQAFVRSDHVGLSLDERAELHYLEITTQGKQS